MFRSVFAHLRSGPRPRPGSWTRAAARAAASLALAGAAILVPAMAGTFDQETVITFDSAVELPGATLPAGTYTFRVLVPNQVVQVFDQKGDVMGTFATSAAQRNDRGKSTVLLEERRADAPMAVTDWFFAGDQGGVEFLYPQR